MMRALSLFFLLLLSTPAMAQAETVDASQQRLIAWLEQDMAKNKQAIAELRAEIKSGKPLRYSISPDDLLKNAELGLKNTNKFLTKVKATPAAQLPADLAALRLSCKQGKCQNGFDASYLDEILLSYGPLVWPLLQAAWVQQDELTQEMLVYLSGRFTPTECRIDWLETPLGHSVFRVRFAALKVAQTTCNEGLFWQRFNTQLERETTPDLILALLDLVPNGAPQSSEYRRRLLEMVEAGRIPLHDAFPKICTEPAPKLELVQRPIDVKFWLNAYRANPSRRMCLVEALFGQINNRDTVEQLTPLLKDAAAHLYGFGAEQTLYERITEPALNEWDSRPQASILLLSNFRQNIPLTSLEYWLKQPGLGLGERMLLTHWLGRDPRDELKDPLMLQLTVTTPDGKIVSDSKTPVSLDKFFQFSAPTATPDFPAIEYTGTLQFNSETMSYRLANFVVGLKPAGAGFNPTIPLLGRFTTDLIVAGKTYRWTLKVNTTTLP